MPDTIIVRKLQFSDTEIQKAFAIRRKVFVEEQNCPAELEYENDEVSNHFLALINGTPCGAARWRKTEKGFKLERFAVLPEYRDKGIGARLVTAVLQDIPDRHLPVYLNAQLAAVNFYKRLGFEPVGEEFVEAGIRHLQMIYVS